MSFSPTSNTKYTHRKPQTPPLNHSRHVVERVHPLSPNKFTTNVFFTDGSNDSPKTTTNRMTYLSPDSETLNNNRFVTRGVANRSSFEIGRDKSQFQTTNRDSYTQNQSPTQGRYGSPHIIRSKKVGNHGRVSNALQPSKDSVTQWKSECLVSTNTHYLGSMEKNGYKATGDIARDVKQNSERIRNLNRGGYFSLGENGVATRDVLESTNKSSYQDPARFNSPLNKQNAQNARSVMRKSSVPIQSSSPSSFGTTNSDASRHLSPENRRQAFLDSFQSNIHRGKKYSSAVKIGELSPEQQREQFVSYGQRSLADFSYG